MSCGQLLNVTFFPTSKGSFCMVETSAASNITATAHCYECTFRSPKRVLYGSFARLKGWSPQAIDDKTTSHHYFIWLHTGTAGGSNKWLFLNACSSSESGNKSNLIIFEHCKSDAGAWERRKRCESKTKSTNHYELHTHIYLSWCNGATK